MIGALDNHELTWDHLVRAWNGGGGLTRNVEAAKAALIAHIRGRAPAPTEGALQKVQKVQEMPRVISARHACNKCSNCKVSNSALSGAPERRRVRGMPYLSFDLTAKDLARLRRLARRRRRSLAQQGAALLELALASGLDEPEAPPASAPRIGHLPEPAMPAPLAWSRSVPAEPRLNGARERPPRGIRLRHVYRADPKRAAEALADLLLWGRRRDADRRPAPDATQERSPGDGAGDKQAHRPA